MENTPTRLGDVLPDETLIYRAFADKSYRHRKKKEVRYAAYLLRECDVADGLSVGLTPEAAVRDLESNEGYCSISVGAIHALPFGLKVRKDLDDHEHAYICNLPLRTLSDDQLKAAINIGNRLADKSTVITCDPYPPPAKESRPSN
jgi:hypothetical protein